MSKEGEVVENYKGSYGMKVTAPLDFSHVCIVMDNDGADLNTSETDKRGKDLKKNKDFILIDTYESDSCIHIILSRRVRK